MKQLGDLNSSNANARTGAQHQHGLSRTDASAPHQHVPGGKKHQRHAGGLVEVQDLRKWDDIHGWHGNQLAIPAIHAVAEHRELRALVLKSGNALRAVIAEMRPREQNQFARLEALNALAVPHYPGCHVTTRNMRQLHTGQPLANPKIEMVYS